MTNKYRSILFIKNIPIKIGFKDNTYNLRVNYSCKKKSGLHLCKSANYFIINHLLFSPFATTKIKTEGKIQVTIISSFKNYVVYIHN